LPPPHLNESSASIEGEGGAIVFRHFEKQLAGTKVLGLAGKGLFVGAVGHDQGKSARRGQQAGDGILVPGLIEIDAVQRRQQAQVGGTSETRLHGRRASGRRR